ncbi:hypothetical protein J6590_031510 [Homalodisca vitripennis]|nr:hypothetical protein J6590_031510 [Homalodisca vitripennis]
MVEGVSQLLSGTDQLPPVDWAIILERQCVIVTFGVPQKEARHRQLIARSRPQMRGSPLQSMSKFKQPFNSVPIAPRSHARSRTSLTAQVTGLSSG